MIDPKDVCFGEGCHTCSQNKKYHAYSCEEIKQIRKEAIDNYKYDLVEKINQLKTEVQKETGSFKWDSCYEDCIEIIKK